MKEGKICGSKKQHTLLHRVENMDPAINTGKVVKGKLTRIKLKQSL